MTFEDWLSLSLLIGCCLAFLAVLTTIIAIPIGLFSLIFTLLF